LPLLLKLLPSRLRLLTLLLLSRLLLLTLLLLSRLFRLPKLLLLKRLLLLLLKLLLLLLKFLQRGGGGGGGAHRAQSCLPRASPYLLAGPWSVPFLPHATLFHRAPHITIRRTIRAAEFCG
jgi:hypothetical protein